MRALCSHVLASIPNPDTAPRPAAFLTVPEAAAEIHATRRFLETRIAAGELRVFKPSRRLTRIRRTDFDAWVELFCSKETQP